MFEIKNSVALITGSTRGIGLELAKKLLAAGGNVIINGRSETAEASVLLEEFGNDHTLLAIGDVSQPDETKRIVHEAAERFGTIDILVHSAGGGIPGKITDLDGDDWMHAFDVHVHPVFHLFRAAHPYITKKGGAVLLISSVAGLRGCPATIAYQTVKGALIPMARALACDHGEENIRVNVLAPGIIRTRFHDAMTDVAKTHNIENRIPIRREGSVEDVASAAMEMLRNEFITGEILTIDGGMSMRITG